MSRRKQPDGIMPATVKKLRCAVYTRKSTDEGLDKEFNTLDAQRESCEAYVASQRAEVAELRVWAPAGLHAAIDAGRGDLADAGSILEISVHDGEQLRCEVVLAPSTRDEASG